MTSEIIDSRGVFLLNILKFSTLHFGGRISPRLQVCFFLSYVLTFVLEESCLKTGTEPVSKTRCVKFQNMWWENSIKAPSSNKNLVIRVRTRETTEKQLSRVTECE
jgi:hypothetical protein